jgi:hypothetical protein
MNWHIFCPRKLSQHLHNASIINMAFTGTWQSVLHELTYLLSQESIAASTQHQPNKYDCLQGHVKAFCMNWHICCPWKVHQHLHNASIINMIFTGTWQSVLHELTYLLSQASIAASTQRLDNKYDFYRDMAKRSAWTDISDVPGKYRSIYTTPG